MGSPLDRAVKAAVERLVKRRGTVRVAVLGDVMLDQFLYGAVERISPEAPVPVVDVERELFRLGGAANVVQNLHSLGARVLLVGAVGVDDNAARIRSELDALGVDHDALLGLDDRPTAIKTRVIAQHQQVVRFDREGRAALPADAPRRMGEMLRERMADIDAIIVSDYAKGVVTAPVMEALVVAAADSGTLIAVDPKPANRHCYRGVGVVTPNVKEAESMTGLPARSDEEVRRIGERLLGEYGCQAVLVTRGEKGMTVVEASGAVTQIPTRARDVYDVTGAGDTTISALTLSRACGADYVAAAGVANLAAGIAVGKLGTAAVTLEELGDALAGLR